MSSRNKESYSWILYGFLLLLRLAAAIFCLGYIHPDEFFQGGQELWFGCSSFLPWEFDPRHALRSVVPPSIMTKIPLLIYSQLNGGASVSAQQLLIVPRLFCAFLTIIVLDVVVWKLNTKKEETKTVPSAVLLLASSWPTMVMLTRPFTNTLETIWLALLLWLVVTAGNHNVSSKRGFLVGVVCAMGIFTRFTFACFALPLGIEYLCQQTKHEVFVENSNKSSDVCNPAKVATHVVIGTILPVSLGFAVTSMFTIYADYSFYYPSRNNSWQSFVAPLNAFLYNVQVDNLREHGLHPKWTHAVVNMHILFGPSTVLSYSSLRKAFPQIVKPARTIADMTSKRRQDDGATAKLCRWILLSGLVLLSSAPHQEPRFLLPLIVPVTILTDDALPNLPRRLRRLFLVVWVAFNLILFSLFGIIHQGGVVPSLLNQVKHQPKALLYFHTYMPPSFLIRRIEQHGGSTATCSAGDSDGTCQVYARQHVCPEYPIVDLQGTDFDVLSKSLIEHLDCNNEEGEFVHLVSPALSSEDNVVSPVKCSLSGGLFDCHVVETYRWHLTTEDLPPFQKGYSVTDWLHDWNLSVYQISCSPG